MKTNICVVIPNWNGGDVIKKCLNSLAGQTMPHDVIVVDNGSTDNSCRLIEKNFPSVTLLKLDCNQGFAGGVNAGIREALKKPYKFIALINNDAEADARWLEFLLAPMDIHPKVGIVTGKLMQKDGRHIDSTGEFLRFSGMPYPRGRDEVDHGQYDEAGEVFAASGGASLYRASLFKKIGLFDEDFFAYYEDVDLSFRAQLQGLKVWYEPRAIARHLGGHTSKKLGSFTRYHSVKNFIMLYNKNMPGVYYWSRKLAFFGQLIRMKLGSLRDGEFGTYLKAFFWALLRVPITLKKRRDIQKRRTLSTDEVKKLLELR